MSNSPASGWRTRMPTDVSPNCKNDKVGAQYKQANSTGVEFSVCPSMSWQIWWAIPLEHVVQEEPFIIQ